MLSLSWPVSLVELAGDFDLEEKSFSFFVSFHEDIMVDDDGVENDGVDGYRLWNVFFFNGWD